jgi:hypothetical protein
MLAIYKAPTSKQAHQHLLPLCVSSVKANAGRMISAVLFATIVHNDLSDLGLRMFPEMMRGEV